ncbi:MAG TPA: malectin domain-containing carbohydrate-binding protein [Chitinophagaceae bacterium]
MKSLAILLAIGYWLPQLSGQSIRQDISLNENWRTVAKDIYSDHFETDTSFRTWTHVNLPHNWDDYHGYRRLVHGNKHGEAKYARTFSIPSKPPDKRYFLFFEGVGSYATVHLNYKKAGEHAGGRTSFTIDITDYIVTGKPNVLAVEADHPPNIKDLPWVCGGCSEERGFSEGSQPMGIFRPVHLIITNDIRIEPFGVHAWADIKDEHAALSVNNTIKNYSRKNRNIIIVNQLVDIKGRIVAEASSFQSLGPGDSLTFLQKNIQVNKPELWSTGNPYLYKIISFIKEGNRIVDKTETDFGFRTINWKNPTNQFFVNGKPVFINGVAEYEHLIGGSHAFSKEQIVSRMNWLRMAGFNAFRDGHQPHNLLYGKLCNEKGILWWTQLSAHVWYDTKEFRDNFKRLLKEWVIERRNDPSVILWGLQNESKLPKEFAEECTALIRSLDPTASSQRLVTTCNGGEGTDWDVPQNWTGTYGGNPDTYADDVKKQVLIGEYGAWRTLDLHTEGGFVQNGILSEDRMTQLMEQKIRLAESVKDSSAGQFFWLLTSHDNPGRVQGGEGLRELDRIGPVNYKGLLTPWEEPLDVFYMFRSNYAPKEKEPMVYIVSHTWPNRWMKPGIKDSIYVYSNCDEVELFNDVNASPLGRQKRNGTGTHFHWDNVNIQYNVLYAVGYVNRKAVARDTIILNHLPQSPQFNRLYSKNTGITKPQSGYKYIYRINCGGPDYKDINGNLWSADRVLQDNSEGSDNRRLTTHHSPLTIHGSSSWTNEFPGMPAHFASQRRTFSPIRNTKDGKLFQSFRYGKNKLQYEFLLPDGAYMVELYFIEPWLGIGGGMDCNGMRLFDVAINNKIVLNDLDIWREAGTNKAIKKTVKVNITGGKMVIAFPETKAGQAVISAIAIATLKKDINESRVTNTGRPVYEYEFRSWLDIGDKQYMEEEILFYSLPSNLYGADWIRFRNKRDARRISFMAKEATNVFVACLKSAETPQSVSKFENTGTEIVTDENGGTYYTVYRKLYDKNENVQLDLHPGCIVITQPFSNMQPAYDLKPVTQYKNNVVKISEGVSKEMVNGRDCASVKENNTVSIEYPVQTGVADIYSITVKYYWPMENELKGKLQLIGAGNSMMLDLPVGFTFTRSGKWNQFTVNTGNMINAGNYIVKLITADAAGLAVSGIDIQ